MTYKFEKGDRVVIQGCSELISDMKARIGDVATIHRLTTAVWEGKVWPCYRIVEDNQRWYWREDWLEFEKEFSIDEKDLCSIIEWVEYGI